MPLSLTDSNINKNGPIRKTIPNYRFIDTLSIILNFNTKNQSFSIIDSER
jgi:hypothetical protein